MCLEGVFMSFSKLEIELIESNLLFDNQIFMFIGLSLSLAFLKLTHRLYPIGVFPFYNPFLHSTSRNLSLISIENPKTSIHKDVHLYINYFGDFTNNDKSQKPIKDSNEILFFNFLTLKRCIKGT